MVATAANGVVHRTMQDEQFLREFRRDPEAALAEYDLDEGERRALKSGDEDRIREAVDDTMQAAVCVCVVVIK